MSSTTALCLNECMCVLHYVERGCVYVVVGVGEGELWESAGKILGWGSTGWGYLILPFSVGFLPG